MGTPSWKVHQRRSRQQETRVASAVAGGRRVVASGSLPSMKGDVRSTRWLVECKTTLAASYGLSLKVLLKIEREAIIASKVPVLQVDIKGRRYVVMTYEDWLLMNNKSG